MTNITHGLSRTRIYGLWWQMWDRCTNPNNPNYSLYGGRGIVVCEEWRDVARFLEDMGPKPAGRSLDRIDNDGPYSLVNCRWATQREQVLNSRRVVMIDFRGERLPLTVWAERLGLCENTLWRRINNPRWTVERSLTTAARRSRYNPASLTFNGKTQSLRAWAKELGIGYHCLRYRAERGWGPERILTPSRRQAA